MDVAANRSFARLRKAAATAGRFPRPELLWLFILAFGFVAVPWLRGRLIGQGDVLHNYAMLSFVAHQIRMGELPSWNPYAVSGFPQLADIPTAFFYPLTVPLAAALPVRDAMNARILLHLILAGSFMYLYLGTVTSSRPARFLGAAIYMLSGASAARIFVADVQRLPVYALMPLSLYLVEQVVQGRQGVGAAVLGGVVVASQFLAGDPQVFLYAAGTLIAYAVYRLTGTSRRGGAGGDAPVPRSSTRPVPLLIAMFAFAACLAAIQALPTLQLFLQSNRSGIDPGFALVGSIPPLGLVSLIAPHFFGTELPGSWGEIELRAPDFYPHASTLYTGFFTAALVIIAVLERRNRWPVRFFGLFGLVVLWLALGKFGYLYRAAVYVPILRSFRDIENISLLLPVSASVLAAIGLDRYGAPDHAPGIWAKTGAILFSTVVAAAVLWDVTLWRTGARGIALLGDPYIRNAVGSSALWILVALGTSGGFLSLRARHRDAAPAWLVAGVAGFVIADLLYAGMPLASAGTDLRAAEAQEAAVVRYLSHDRTRYRVTGLSELTALAGLETAEGEPGLLLDRYSEYTNFVQGYPLDTRLRPAGVHGVLIQRGFGSPLLGLLNVKYFVLHSPRHPGHFIYVNPAVRPRVLDAYRYTVLRDRLAILRELSRPGYDPRRRVILEETPRVPADDLSSSEPPAHHADLRIVSYGANRVVIHARFARPGFLVLDDPYYPAWTASVDRRPATIYRANYLFRAVRVPAGDHEVRFLYRDRFLQAGAAVSSLAGIAGVLAWAVDRIRRRRASRRDAPPSAV